MTDLEELNKALAFIKAVRNKASRDGLIAEESVKHWGEGVHAQSLYHKGRASAFQDIVTFIDSHGCWFVKPQC